MRHRYRSAARTRDRKGSTVTHISNVCPRCGTSCPFVRRPDGTLALRHVCQAPMAGPPPATTNEEPAAGGEGR